MDFAEHLKSQLDIVDVVGHYVRLKRVGASPSLVALCPFHNEKTPSFNVHSVRQFYKCFSCDAKGDLINFVMQMDGLTFWRPSSSCRSVTAFPFAAPAGQRSGNAGS